MDETLEKFRDFIRQTEEPKDKQNWRRWMIFFHDDCGVIPNEKKNGITLSVFIGFENIESQNIIYMAGEKCLH